MPNGSEFVDWGYMREHEQRADKGFDRLERLEAEVIGDETTGRLSLRSELTKKLDDALLEMRKTPRAIWRSMFILIFGLIIKAIFDYAVLQNVTQHIK